MSKKIDKLEVWISYCNENSECRDYSGRKILYSAYNNRNSRYCWNIDHIRPLALGGINKTCNLVPTHMETNDEKGDTFPHWEANGNKYKAIRTAKNCYDIVRND